jgi:cytochrome P450
MTAGGLALDPARIRELFDLRSSVYTRQGGAFEEDPYPGFHRLRESGPVHEGTPGRLVGFEGAEFFQGLPEPDRRHFSAFDFETCDAIVRTPEIFRSAPPDPGDGIDGMSLYDASMLSMDGDKHRRYRALVQPSFVPGKAQWWIQSWIGTTVHALLDSIEGNGRADLNVEFCAAIPLLTICGSFGVSVEDALDIRAAVTSEGRGVGEFMQIVHPILAARREDPQDDLISILVQAELTEDGVTHVLSDAEILAFAFLLLAAGSGTTWKQMGTTLVALLQHPEWIPVVRDDPTALRALIEEGVRWMPTDPVFSRWTWEDTTLRGVDIPAGAVVHPCFGAANRDPARWDRPDEFDPGRTPRTHLAFGSGPHVCIGMHVARAEIHTAVSAVLDRLPGLRLDPDAEAPRIIGMYERGPTAVPAVWDA